jgi:hypothetical protein
VLGIWSQRMFDELRELGIKLDGLGESCLQKQLDEIIGNVNEEDLNNEDFMRGMSRILCGILGFYIDSDYPSPFKEFMLFAYVKYSFIAVIELKRRRGFNLSYEVKNINVDEFKDLDKDFDTKVTLAQSEAQSLRQEGEQNERREESDRREA